MKKGFIIIALFNCFLSGFGQINTYQSPKATTLPTFDGDTIDNIWTLANWKSINQVWIPYNNIFPSPYLTESGTKTITGAADFSGRYKMTWSETDSLLLFLVEIHDDVFIDGYVPNASGYSNFDVIEVFIDENQSGGNHLFDNMGNAQNAFSYHMMVNAPTVGGVTTSLTGAMDIYGNSYSNIINYKAHFPMYSLKNYGGGRYVYEFAMRIYKDTYDNNNPFASRRSLSVNNHMGFTLAYCDNDENDNMRNHFIGSVTVSGADNNNSYINASLFGTLILTGHDDTPPSIPTNLTITNAVLSWSPSTDDISVVGYNLYQNHVFLTSLTGLTHILPGYTPGSTYQYKVNAFDGSGNVSGFSDSINYSPVKPELMVLAENANGGCLSGGFTVSGINLLDTVYVNAKALYCGGLHSNSNSVIGYGSLVKIDPFNSNVNPVGIMLDFYPCLTYEHCVDTNLPIYISSKFADTITLCLKMCITGIIADPSNQMEIYPNPVNDILKINLRKPGTVNITNVLGVTVFNSSFSEGLQTINLGDLKKGYYLLNIQQQNEPTLVKPIIKE